MLQEKINENPNSQYDKSFLERNYYALKNNKKEVATKDSTKKVWKGSDIAKMKPWEFEKFEKEIDLARQEGRINMNS